MHLGPPVCPLRREDGDARGEAGRGEMETRKEVLVQPPREPAGQLGPRYGVAGKGGAGRSRALPRAPSPLPRDSGREPSPALRLPASRTRRMERGDSLHPVAGATAEPATRRHNTRNPRAFYPWPITGGHSNSSRVALCSTVAETELESRTDVSRLGFAAG